MRGGKKKKKISASNHGNRDESAPLTGRNKFEITRIHTVDKVEDHQTISDRHGANRDESTPLTGQKETRT